VDKVERELELEDAMFEEIWEGEEGATSLDTELIDNDEFVQRSVDAEDLATGFNATIPTREIDVDEDIQGDEMPEVGGEKLLTEFGEVGDANAVVHGDEIELDLTDALATGRTVTRAPEGA